jgi:type I restriction enzyme S subunit
MSKQWPCVKLREVLTPAAREEAVDASKEYRLLGIRLEGQGPFLRETVMGTQTSAAKLFRVAKGDFIYSRLFACRGAFGVISEELDGCYVSGEFPTFVPAAGNVNVQFLKYWFRLPSVIATVDADCSGSTPLTRNRFKENFFLALEIPLPPLAEQRRVVARIEELAAQINEARTLRQQAGDEAALWSSASCAMRQNHAFSGRFGQWRSPFRPVSSRFDLFRPKKRIFPQP